MRSFVRRSIQIVFLLAPILAAQERPAAPAPRPLIDRELLFAKPDISAAQLSPDGKYLAFVKPWQGALNVWVKKTGNPASAARPLTADGKHPVFNYLWTRSGKYLCFVKAGDPDQSFNLYAVDPSAPIPSGADAPPSRDLTRLEGAEIRLYS